MRALWKTGVDLKQFVTDLNKLLLDDSGSAPYALCVLSIVQNKLSFISCGYGYLWRNGEPLKNTNSHLKKDGAELYESIFLLNEGDQLLLYCGGLSPEIEAIVAELSVLPPQDKAEKIMRKLRLLSMKKGARAGCSVLCIKKT